MKDTNLLPYILPNVFVISQFLTPSQFASQVLPSLKPLFAVRDPPQNMMTLLDNLTMLQDKTDSHVFRERKSICIPSRIYLKNFLTQMCFLWFITRWNQSMQLWVYILLHPWVLHVICFQRFKNAPFRPCLGCARPLILLRSKQFFSLVLR